jgi:hypothetical protein
VSHDHRPRPTSFGFDFHERDVILGSPDQPVWSGEQSRCRAARGWNERRCQQIAKWNILTLYRPAMLRPPGNAVGNTDNKSGR